MKDIKKCAYCVNHRWFDHKEHHICIRDGSAKTCEDSCLVFKGNSQYNYLNRVGGKSHG